MFGRSVSRQNMKISSPHNLCSLLLLFLLSGVSEAGEPSLLILPSQEVIVKPIGQAVLMTCKVQSDDNSLVSNIQWRDTRNRTIEPPSRSGESRFTLDEIPAEKSLILIIQPLHKNDAGTYSCMASYANSKTLVKTVTLSPIVAVTWEDAPTEQYPLAGRDYRVKCKVKADPAPHVEWTINGLQVPPNNARYVVETDGLLIQDVTESDDGIYTCRAFVLDTGELSERKIKVEVHTPPRFLEKEMVKSVEAVDGESTSIQCLAEGKPAPHYSWIKSPAQINLASAERFAVEEKTGLLRVLRVQRDDSGEYKCVANNGAGTVEWTVRLLVIVKPALSDIKNVTFAVGKEAKLECRASGNPLPAISFQKLSSAKVLITGIQPDDDRITVDQREDRGRNEAVGILKIADLARRDDGLYRCIATNKGGKAEKNGHIEVQFRPSFEHSVVKEVWTWSKRPVNLTCIAESIPNATISWRFNNRDIDNDPNFRKFGNGPESSLLVTPGAYRTVYGVYMCVAKNTLGDAWHEITLKEARVPGEILQATLEVVTATTITFKFMGPGDTGGRPIKAYSVQYKTDRQNWNEAMNQTWPLDSPYILENLTPQVTYILRFAALNEVGLGPWGASKEQTMPRRSSPGEPLILNQKDPEGYVIATNPNRFELRWKKPADNGEIIDQFEIKFCPVERETGRNDKVVWTEVEPSCSDVKVVGPEMTSVDVSNLSPDTFFKVELRAHNLIGFSTPAEIIVHTPQGKDSLMFQHDSLHITSSLLIGAVVATLLVILVIIDISCYFVNDTGILWLICGKKKSQKPKQEDLKRNSEGKELLSNGNRDGKVRIESSTPMLVDNGYKRDTTVEYDVKKSISRTSFVGKDSAV